MFKIQEKMQITARTASFIHFAIALFLFLPSLLAGAILVGSSDNFFHLIPNTLFTVDSIHNWSLGKWNPYILNGIDFTSSTHNHIWSPFNWPLFLFPTSWFVHLFTARVILEIYLVGFFSFLFFRKELRDARWALFASLAYQLCGFMFFAVTTYSNLELYLLLPLALFLLWSIDERPAWRTFFYLTLTLSTILLSANIIYSATYILTIIGMSFYRYGLKILNPFNGPARVIGVLLGSGIFALSIAAIKWIPVVFSLVFDGNRASAFQATLDMSMSRCYYGLTAVIPETFGLSLGHSLPVFRMISPLDGGHAQFHGYMYLGAVFSSVLLLSLFQRGLTKRSLAVVFLLLSAWTLSIPPIDTLIAHLLSPFIHGIVPKVPLPILACLLAAHASKRIERNWDLLEARHFYIIFISVGVSLLCAAMIWGYRFELTNLPLKEIEIGLGIYMFLLARSAILGRYLVWAGASFIGVVGFVLYKSLPLFSIDMYFTAFYFSAIPIFGSAAVLTSLHLFNAKKVTLTFFKRSVIAILAVILFLSLGSISAKRDMTFEALFYFFLVGATKYLAMAYLLVALLASAKRDTRLRPYFANALCLLLVFELFPYNRNYSRQVVEPILPKAEYYPNLPPRQFLTGSESTFRDLLGRQQRSNLDLDNYRINNPEVVLGFRQTPLEANLTEIYRVRSYGGVNSDVSSRYHKLLQSFDPRVSDVLAGLSPELKQHKLLDYLGVKYDAAKPGEPFERPHVVSRLMFFERFRVANSDQDALELMKDETFSATDRVIVDSNPSLAEIATSSGVDRSEGGFKLNYQTLSYDTIRVTLDGTHSGIVFFGDTYNRGWKASIDGTDSPVLRANFNFMGVVVRTGNKDVIFHFEPEMFYIGRRVSTIGAIVFILTSLILAFVAYNKRSLAIS